MKTSRRKDEFSQVPTLKCVHHKMGASAEKCQNPRNDVEHI
uniref:Uncharacterized protein n=1 Tax=Arundo donax TaxID=35708 RepID=A0A0A9HIF1_ARUDO